MATFGPSIPTSVDGIEIVTSIEEWHGTVFQLTGHDRGRARISVDWPEFAKRFGQGYVFEAADLSLQVSSRIVPGIASVFAEMMQLAAEYAQALNDAFDLEAARAEVQDEQDRIEQERQRRGELVKARIEALQWYLGQPMRLKRKNYKSRVMGHIKDIRERGDVVVITERNAVYYLHVREITYFEVKYEGDTRYTEVELPSMEEVNA